MRITTQDLGLERITILYPGSAIYRLSDKVAVMPLSRLAEPSAKDELVG